MLSRRPELVDTLVVSPIRRVPPPLVQKARERILASFGEGGPKKLNTQRMLDHVVELLARPEGPP